MKKIFLFSSLFFLSFSLSAQVKVSILGDSYSTFKGWNPEGQNVWYDENRRNDVENVDETWWWQLINENGLSLEKNNSWSGATICNTGYNGADYTDRSFLTRATSLGEAPDIIYVFGGTNDAWAGSPLGEMDGSDMFTVRPAAKAMFKKIKETYPNALYIAIINTELSKDIENILVDTCEIENIPYVKLKDIDKQAGHPSVNGMKQISKQVWKATAPHLFSKLKENSAK